MFQPENKHLRSGYARVCQEWQLFFEPDIFKQLLISQHRISDLDKFTARVPRRQKLVQEIHLCIKLPEYNSAVSQLKRSAKVQTRRCNAAFTKAIRSLLAVLSKWPEVPSLPPNARSWEKGIALSISTYSPSDRQHGFRQFDSQEGGYPIWFIEDALTNTVLKFPAQRAARAAQEARETAAQPSHDDTSLVAAAREHITQTLTIHGGNFREVPRIHSLSICRQSYRGISTTTLKKFLLAFPNLRTLVHEPWLDVTTDLQHAFTTSYLSVLDTLALKSKHLTSLTLFQCPSHSYSHSRSYATTHSGCLRRRLQLG